MLIRIIFVGMVGLAGCSDDVSGKALGEPCVAHEECASKLCTTPAMADSGARSDAGLTKRCAEPGLTP
jgi:hypothetical protein